MNEAQVGMDPQIYMETVSEEAHQALNVRLVLKAQIKQLELLLAQYQEHFGELPSHAAESPTGDSTTKQNAGEAKT